MPSAHAVTSRHTWKLPNPDSATRFTIGKQKIGLIKPADPLAYLARCTGTTPPPVWEHRARFTVSIDYDFGEFTSIGHDAQVLSCDISNEATSTIWWERPYDRVRFA